MPAFMIGTQRSGSNMLRLMLNQLSDWAAPHPPHIMERLAPLMPVYGDLSDEGAFARLVDDVCRLIELNPVPWDGVSLDRDRIAVQCRERSLVAVYGAVHDAASAQWGASDWCCKSLANVHHLPAIIGYFPDARFVYLHRDGRDVALSFREAIVGEKHFHTIASNWHREQTLALELYRSLGPARVHKIAYETLTADPENALRALCEFLGTEYTDAMMIFHESTEATNTARAGAMWSQVAKPVMRSRPPRYPTETSEEDLRIFESVAGASLDALGYPRALLAPGEELVFDADTLDRFNAENRRLKDVIKAQVSPEELQLRSRQQALLDEIAGRARLDERA